MAYGDESTPTAIEARLERRFPAYHFGGVLMLLFLTFGFTASGAQGAWAQVVSITLQGLTLSAALLAARTSRRLLRLAAVISVVAIISALVAAIVTSSDTTIGAFFAVNALLVGTTPVVIGRALWRRQVIDVHTVLGAVCIYVLIGMLFSFVYTTIGLVGDTAFFAQTNRADVADFLYFSFITLTTVGYGDFTAAHGLGRALASFEALLGQLYLVTIVAVLVGRVAPRRGASRAASDDAGTNDEPGGAQQAA